MKSKEVEMVNPNSPLQLKINWNHCILCQKDDKKVLKNPRKILGDRQPGFKTLAENLMEFSRIEGLNGFLEEFVQGHVEDELESILQFKFYDDLMEQSNFKQI